MLSVSVLSKKYNIEFTLSYKLIFIVGDSGTGKTGLRRAALAINAPYKWVLSDERYTIRVLTSENYIEAIERSLADNKRHIFIIDDEDFVKGSNFARLFNSDTLNYYVILARTSARLGNISGGNRLGYSMDAIYEIEKNGVHHRLIPYYKAEAFTGALDKVAVEGIGSDYSFFSHLSSNVVSLGGKENMLSLPSRTANADNYLLLIDRDGVGSTFEKFYRQQEKCGSTCVIPANYLSFEWFLLRSNLFNYDFSKISVDDIAAYPTRELLFEHILVLESETKLPRKYTKSSKILPCFIAECNPCQVQVNKGKCRVGLPAPKVETLFRGTEFEELIRVILSI